jgi:hypothetical protein
VVMLSHPQTNALCFPVPGPYDGGLGESPCDPRRRCSGATQIETSRAVRGSSSSRYTLGMPAVLLGDRYESRLPARPATGAKTPLVSLGSS